MSSPHPQGGFAPGVSRFVFAGDSLWEICVTFALCTQLCKFLFQKVESERMKAGEGALGLDCPPLSSRRFSSPWLNTSRSRARAQIAVRLAGVRAWGVRGVLGTEGHSPSLPQDAFLPLSSFPLEAGRRGQEQLLGQGVRLIPFAPKELASPLPGQGEEVINDSMAGAEGGWGEHSGLMLVLIRSWSPVRDSIQLGQCVCVCGGVGMRACTRTRWGWWWLVGAGAPDSPCQPLSLSIVSPPPPSPPPLFCWKSLLLSVFHLLLTS